MPAPQRHEDDLRRAILSRNFYGPYGKEFAAGEITGDDTPVGLDLYDFGARMYSPSNMRWLTMDPLCEKYYSISPYAYCAGDPVNLVDPDGMQWYTKYLQVLNRVYVFHILKMVICSEQQIV